MLKLGAEVTRLGADPRDNKLGASTLRVGDVSIPKDRGYTQLGLCRLA